MVLGAHGRYTNFRQTWAMRIKELKELGEFIGITEYIPEYCYDS